MPHTTPTSQPTLPCPAPCPCPWPPSCRPLVSDRAHAPRASNVEELRALQKSFRERDAAALGLRDLSLSETLRSKARQVSRRRSPQDQRAG